MFGALAGITLVPTPRSWDYFVSTALVHWAVSCIGLFVWHVVANRIANSISDDTVMMEFPTDWVYWLVWVGSTVCGVIAARTCKGAVKRWRGAIVHSAVE